MSESKVYMFPDSDYHRGNSDAALWATIANTNRNNNDPMATMAMMNGGMNGMWNNPLTH